VITQQFLEESFSSSSLDQDIDETNLCTKFHDNSLRFSRTQLDDSGHRIQQDAGGKMRENTRNRWNVQPVLQPEIIRIFSSGFLPTSSAFRQKRLENIGKHPKIFHPEYCFHKITGIIWNQQFSGWIV